MALIEDLRDDLDVKNQQLASERTRLQEWTVELNRLINRQNQSITPHNFDTAIAEARSAINDANSNIARLNNEISLITNQLNELVAATAEGVSSGLSEGSAQAQAEINFSERIKKAKEEEEAKKSWEQKKKYIIGGAIIIGIAIVTTVTIYLFKRMRNKAKA